MNHFSLAIAALAAGLCAGCELEQPCDPGQIIWNKICVDPPADASDASMPAANGDSCIAADQAFGASCAAASDCDCLDVCNTYAGPGYCTRTGCKQDPSLCPSGWSCADLSGYLPGQPSMCMRP